ncbi:transmembrane protein 154 [Morone saxatilis]|uniref:transmembrane protein 154 n=1 Tax=Morone saxatilis TaxID=34816 RepID=UPI0015E1BC19|nr:transmembrane protein 154 [Morone saxatilis]
MEPEPEPDPEPEPEPEPDCEPEPDLEVVPKITTDEDVTDEKTTEEDNGSGDTQDTGETENDPNMTNTQEDEGLSLIIILIPVVLVVLIIGMIVCAIFINRRWNKKGRNQELRQEDPYLDGSSTEKVPMPMFEEDVPSVLELEMEELDQWMKKDGETTEDTKHE